MSLNLPAYIIRGEQLVVEVTLFNYLMSDLEVSSSVIRTPQIAGGLQLSMLIMQYPL